MDLAHLRNIETGLDAVPGLRDCPSTAPNTVSTSGIMLNAIALSLMSWPERRAAIKQALYNAIAELLARDSDLIASGAHEQSICHRLAVYLESSTDLNVDCEYNRNMMRAKRLQKGQPFRPDIIVHRRLSNDENVLVVEAKSRAQNSASDVKKLKELTAEVGTYQYWTGAFIVFFNEPATVIRYGVLRVSIDWFTPPEKEEHIEIVRPVPNDLLRRITVDRAMP